MGRRPTAWRAYVQIADALRQRITDGALAPGALLPSEARLSTEFSVVRNTARRALATLEAEGLIDTIPGLGRVVRARGDAPDAAAQTTLQYRRIATDLRNAIERGDLAPGDLLPSEASLVATYGVSRGTARQALAELESVGLVESVHGKGRYVRPS